MKNTKRADEIRDILMRANEAKDRLARIAEDLEALGASRKAKSCMNLVYKIEAWQNTGL